MVFFFCLLPSYWETHSYTHTHRQTPKVHQNLHYVYTHSRRKLYTCVYTYTSPNKNKLCFLKHPPHRLIHTLFFFFIKTILNFLFIHEIVSVNRIILYSGRRSIDFFVFFYCADCWKLKFKKKKLEVKSQKPDHIIFMVVFQFVLLYFYFLCYFPVPSHPFAIIIFNAYVHYCACVIRV